MPFIITIYNSESLMSIQLARNRTFWHEILVLKCIKNVTNSELLDQFLLLPEKVRLHLYEMILEINKK